MKFAQLLFYAVASFFLGLIAITIGGARVLQQVLDPAGSSLLAPPSDAPFRAILLSLTMLATFVFLGLAIIVGLRHGDR
jgi:hypothetical protein